ncbi:MAG: ExeA family protein [Bryobacteraceae bacterium]
MYLQYFGLEKNPFSLTPDPRFLFLTSKHREALAALLFAVIQRKGFMVLTGDAGTGKTTLVRKLLLSIPADCAQFSIIVNPALTPSEFLEFILMDFGLEHVPSSKALRLSLFKNLLLHAQSQGKTSVLVVDEAHLLTAELVEEIRLLSNFETAEQKLLQILLVGQSELDAVLQLESMRQVRQRVAIRTEIGPLSPSEIAAYLETRWRRAGTLLPLPFSAEAVELIARASEGIPRIINVICDAALTSAYGAGLNLIGVAQILEVARDLRFTIPAASPSTAAIAAPESLPQNSTPSRVAAQQPIFKTIERYLPDQQKTSRLHKIASWFWSSAY